MIATGFQASSNTNTHQITAKKENDICAGTTITRELHVYRTLHGPALIDAGGHCARDVGGCGVAAVQCERERTRVAKLFSANVI